MVKCSVIIPATNKIAAKIKRPVVSSFPCSWECPSWLCSCPCPWLCPQQHPQPCSWWWWCPWFSLPWLCFSCSQCSWCSCLCSWHPHSCFNSKCSFFVFLCSILFSFFQNVIHSAFNNLLYMIVCQRIINNFSIPLSFYQIRISQNS